MKALVIGLIGFTMMLFGGWNVLSAERTPPVKLHTQQDLVVEYVSTINELTGTWHAFPGGLVIRFNDDGSAQFGLDTGGTVLGYDAVAKFENQLLSIQFTNYDGQNKGCHRQVGLYSVQSHQGGYISFAPIVDDCIFRLESLSGPAETGVGMMFHPLQD